ncbi:hypothetical protein [Helicobacter sp. 23-1046]
MCAKILLVLCVVFGAFWLNGCSTSVPQNAVVKKTIIVSSKHKTHKHHHRHYRF